MAILFCYLFIISSFLLHNFNIHIDVFEVIAIGFCFVVKGLISYFCDSLKGWTVLKSNIDS